MTDQSMTVGIIANPVSGRDIRRVAARGGVSSAEDKRNRIARAVIGAVAGGARHIVAMKEPFGIATGALTDLPVDAELEILDVGARVDPMDTVRAALAMKERGISVIITLGGDGTNRTIARVWPDVTLVPMSTGTNNVFPSLVEPTVAGAAAGLVATNRADEDLVAPRSKMIHLISGDGSEDVALIDAATLANDFVGNRMPVDPNNLRQLVVSTARPDTIGVSSVAGLHTVCLPQDDTAVVVTCGSGGALTNAPIAPGLYQKVPVLDVKRIELDQEIDLVGPSTLAVDGDREHQIPPDSVVRVAVRRDGPRVVNVSQALEVGASNGFFVLK
ncbi:MAG: NAD(+)/NADH kinase [Acidimicrobiales bacterium]|nr:NAD(+)/NADH kinase [Acidimicrobiales bacterium]